MIDKLLLMLLLFVAALWLALGAVLALSAVGDQIANGRREGLMRQFDAPKYTDVLLPPSDGIYGLDPE